MMWFQPSMQPPERAEAPDHGVGAADVGRAGEVAADQTQEHEDGRAAGAGLGGGLGEGDGQQPERGGHQGACDEQARSPGPMAPQWAPKSSRPADQQDDGLERAPPGTPRCTCPPRITLRGVGVVNRRGQGALAVLVDDAAGRGGRAEEHEEEHHADEHLAGGVGLGLVLPPGVTGARGSRATAAAGLGLGGERLRRSRWRGRSSLGGSVMPCETRQLRGGRGCRAGPVERLRPPILHHAADDGRADGEGRVLVDLDLARLVRRELVRASGPAVRPAGMMTATSASPSSTAARAASAAVDQWSRSGGRPAARAGERAT